MLTALVRFQARLFAFRRGVDTGTGARVVLVGAGEAGAAVLREMQRDAALRLNPVALFDDDARKHGRRLLGVPVLGSVAQLPALAAHLAVDQAYLAIAHPPTELVQRAAHAAERAEVPLKVLPRVGDFLRSDVVLRQARTVRIEDLLGRTEVRTDLEEVRRLLHGRRVLVTGAGGSIGSEIARQASAFGPATLTLVDHDETHLHDAAARLGPCRPELADIRDPAALLDVFARNRPHIVFHAAAHKHVPMLEDHPCEAVATNVAGVNHLLQAAASVGVETFVFISTDKAVRPSSVMGATKRLGEQIVLHRAPAGMAACAVRFGNVLGSRGSVIPTFTRQIEAGGPVTITHPDMTRFFMSVEEAVQLVLQAAALASGGEVFMLDMGEPVRILELAERMIRLSGHRVEEDIAIEFTGVRAGEKLTEELHAEDERPEPTVHPSILRLFPTKADPDLLDEGLERLVALVARREHDAVKSLVHELAGLGSPLGGRAVETAVG